jgi:hypothetical protein
MEQGTFYFKYNALKTMILKELRLAKKAGESGTTCQQISDRTGIPRHRITDIMGKWHKRHYRYVRRLQKKEAGGNGRSYRYVITPYGEQAYKRYMDRLENQYDLNLKRKHKIKETASQLGITKKGQELGVTIKDAWDEINKTKEERKKQVEDLKLLK